MPPSNAIEEAQETNSAPRPDSGVLDYTDFNSEWTPLTVLGHLPSSQQPQTLSSSPLAFFHILERLKTTKREGWRRFGIIHGESISDHMYRMAIITMVAPPSLSSRLDLNRCTKMALVHDMAELLVGDITPVDGILKSEKNRREATTMDYLCDELLGNVDGGAQAKEIRQLWQEYEDSQTLESQFVHDVDKVELVLQMVEYERSHGGRIDLHEFAHVAQRVVCPEVKTWCEALLKERQDFWKAMGQDEIAKQVPPETRKLQDEYYENGVKH